MNSGVILGKTGKEIVTDSTNENVLVCGPCRCGKGANTVIPTLKTFQKSVFAIDWHGEASWFSINDRKKMGQDVFVISPEESDDLSNFASFNPLEEIDKETEITDAMTISLLLLIEEFVSVLISRSLPSLSLKSIHKVSSSRR